MLSARPTLYTRGMPIRPELEAELERRLPEVRAGRLSARALARLVGVARNTVDAIVRGDRPVRLARDHAAKFGGMARTIEPRRCQYCGRKIKELRVDDEPCRACLVEAALAMARRRPQPFARNQGNGDPLRLRLKPHHRRRYEEVRRARQRLEAELGSAAADESTIRTSPAAGPDTAAEPTDEQLRRIESAATE